VNKYDFQRLEKYIKNLVKYQLIIDLIPILSKFFFSGKFNVKLAYSQAAILLGMGLQYKSFEEISVELNIQTNQLLALFNKLVKKFTNQIKLLYEREIDKDESAKEKYKSVLKIIFILVI
jgi:N-acetyltransferase 10